MASRRCTVPSGRLSITDSTCKGKGKAAATASGQSCREGMEETQATCSFPWLGRVVDSCSQHAPRLHAALWADGHHQAAAGCQLLHQVLGQAGGRGAHLRMQHHSHRNQPSTPQARQSAFDTTTPQPTATSLRVASSCGSQRHPAWCAHMDGVVGRVCGPALAPITHNQLQRTCSSARPPGKSARSDHKSTAGAQGPSSCRAAAQ